MARQEIILGTPPAGLGGDPPRTASMKINAMTQELYEKNAALGALSKMDVAPVDNGGTGATNVGAARASLGLGSSATHDLTVTADDMTLGRVLKVGDRGIGSFLSDRAVSDALVPISKGGFDFSFLNYLGAPSGSKDGSLLTQSYSKDAFASQIFIDWQMNIMKVRTIGAYGTSPSAWATMYSTANTTRAADGTLKAI